jgi:hypothetical protein
MNAPTLYCQGAPEQPGLVKGFCNPGALGPTREHTREGATRRTTARQRRPSTKLQGRACPTKQAGETNRATEPPATPRTANSNVVGFPCKAVPCKQNKEKRVWRGSRPLAAVEEQPSCPLCLRLCSSLFLSFRVPRPACLSLSLPACLWFPLSPSRAVPVSRPSSLSLSPSPS